MDLKERRREEIILAAMNVFLRNGFDRSKMEAIAAEAGIGKGTIYGYFSSKEELFEKMICYNLDRYKKELSNIVTSQQSFSEKLKRLLEHHANFLNQNVDVFHIINNGKMLSHSMRERLIKEQDSFLKSLEKILKKGIENEEIREDIDHEVTLLCIIGAINQLAGKRIFIDKTNVNNMDSKLLIDVIMKGMEN